MSNICGLVTYVMRHPYLGTARKRASGWLQTAAHSISCVWALTEVVCLSKHPGQPLCGSCDPWPCFLPRLLSPPLWAPPTSRRPSGKVTHLTSPWYRPALLSTWRVITSRWKCGYWPWSDKMKDVRCLTSPPNNIFLRHNLKWLGPSSLFQQAPPACGSRWELAGVPVPALVHLF